MRHSTAGDADSAGSAPDSAGSAPDSAWQREDDGRTAAVLHEVFAWLGGRQLAEAGAVCRAWRRAAAAPPLWRRLLLRHHAASAHTSLQHPYPVSWRQEYVDTQAGWELRAREPLGGGGALHAALAPAGTRLALAGEDAWLQVWARGAHGWAGTWRTQLTARGWRSAVRVHWAPAARAGADRLLVLGALALVDSWELVVFHLDETGAGRVAASARCSTGGAGCWADAAGGAFLSLELSLLAPRLACTTVWLNAASQETQSEYAGVRTPLLRIFNENSAHITFAAVAQVPLETAGGATLGVLVTASGADAAAGGSLAAWPLTALRPPPVLAVELGDLRERVRRRAARLPPPAADPPPPDEATVRALCDPPEAVCALPAPPVGFLVHPSGRCVWVSLSGGGAWCVELPTLRALRYLPPAAPAPPLAPWSDMHYVQPSVSNSYFVSPRGSHGGGVCVWRVRSGATVRAPSAHPAPALAALLPPAPPACPGDPTELLVLAGEYLYIWTSRSTAQPADESLQPPPPPASLQPPPPPASQLRPLGVEAH